MKDILSYYEVEDAEEKHVQDLIQQLPKVKRKTNVFAQVYLQWKITPFYFYIIFLLLLCVCITLLQGYDVKKQIFNIYFTMFLYMTSNVLLMIPEMMRSQIYQCAKIEKTCKYNMVQILCYRLILFTTMLLVSVCMITFYTSRIYPLSFIRLFALMICNLQLTLLLTVCLYLMWKINDVKIMILIYTGCSLLISCLILPKLIISSIYGITFCLIISFICICILIKRLWKGIKNYEINSGASYKNIHS
ncbi:hypothetical protein [[Eubacterium] hominis]|uniref:Uncharacterized protein n=1 Tax=[Eubacterium] hominis TaxID=2764325 RepID=A0A7G9GN81_9FIRM|nr:hypothetical protein H9Q80_18810 [[Eubacterium] hominis]